ncbi:MAG: hypothetical protein EOP04_07670 [Proteobacteria bacterium]|nr:MAG: hypothetical protein EOP04_07670 [Pseudomonadota bacterium]
MELNQFDVLMDINREAFDDGDYDLAYHVLAAAYWCACHYEDLEQALLIERMARTQGEWIDNHAPYYEHSTYQVKNRDSSKGGMFNELALQASELNRILRLI